MKTINEKLIEELKDGLQKAGSINETITMAMGFLNESCSADKIYALQNVMEMQKEIIDKCSKILEDL
jgi:ABC-type polysaccharide/polyol phosphate transport system ATPase subunit